MASRGKSDRSRRNALLAVLVVAIVALGAGTYFAVSAQRDGGGDSTSTPVALDTTPAATAITVPETPNLLVLGDSYTEGTAAQPKTLGWAYLVSKALGWPSRVDGVGGTGFTWGGGDAGTDGEDYASRIAKADGSVAPNVLILQGGQNDYRATPEEVSAKVGDTIDEARAKWPNVQIVVIGPSQPQPGGNMLARVSDPIGTGAASRGVPFISPIKLEWFTDENSEGFYGDANGAHPNTAGHRYLAGKILAELQKVGFPAATVS